MAIRGTLHSVDQYLNIKLLNIEVVQPEKFPHMVRAQPPVAARARAAECVLTPTAPRPAPARRAVRALSEQQSVKHCFVRGSVIRCVQLPKADIDVELLQDATRKEAQQQRAAK